MLLPVQVKSAATVVETVRLHAAAAPDALGSHVSAAPDTLGGPESQGSQRPPANAFPRPSYLPPALASLEWVNKFGEIASWENKWAVLLPHWAFFFPVVATVACWSPTWLECLQVFLAWLSMASLTLTMNHRYFAHAAFKTTRAGRALCACIGCLGLQYGPLWWSSKHRKHHKLCDVPGDPHSWKGTSFCHAWFGWLCSVEERHIDVAYLHPSLFVDAAPNGFTLPASLTPLQKPAPAKGARVVAPELLLIDRLWFLPTILVYLTLMLLVGVSQRAAFFYFVGPSLCLPLPILLFNVMFHPPDTTPTAGGCYALDSLLDPLAVILGEAAHEDHHRFPDRIQRPSPLPFGFDLCYEAILRPLLTIGLIWDPKHYKTAARTGKLPTEEGEAPKAGPKASGPGPKAVKRAKAPGGANEDASVSGTPAGECDGDEVVKTGADHSRKTLALVGLVGM
jgi:stearoyl-CoA desaturase (delta-9 desaturase)